MSQRKKCSSLRNTKQTAQHGASAAHIAVPSPRGIMPPQSLCARHPASVYSSMVCCSNRPQWFYGVNRSPGLASSYSHAFSPDGNGLSCFRLLHGYWDSPEISSDSLDASLRDAQRLRAQIHRLFICRPYYTAVLYARQSVFVRFSDSERMLHPPYPAGQGFSCTYSSGQYPFQPCDILYTPG